MRKTTRKTILITRFSAFGDVVMTVKLIKTVVKQNPEFRFVFITRKNYAFLFENIERLTVYTPDLKNKHKGIIGLWNLSKELKHFQPFAFADIHNVLRTKLLRVFLSFSGIKKRKINKGRLAKKCLVRRHRKVFKPLKNTVERYADVFKALGLKADISENMPSIEFTSSNKLNDFIESGINIGIAPFAMHAQKMYPLDKMRDLIYILSKKSYNIYLFGGGKKELEQAEKLTEGISRVKIVIGRFSLIDELKLISKLNLMITMDSANMHLANLTQTKILAIWGGTHPFAGFVPYANSNYHQIQIDQKELPCRPCSIYGKKPCYRGDFACMNNIQAKTIFNEIEKILQQHKT